MVAKQRINWIDWSKMIGIYLVILGHLYSGSGVDGEIHNFIYLFHMPFFFFISGYLFRIKDNSFIDFLKRCFRSLLIPYFLLNLVGNIFLLPTWILSHRFPYDQLFYFLTADGHGESGPTWFLICLLWVQLSSYFIIKWSLYHKVILCICCCVFAYLFPFHLWWRLDTAIMVLPYFLIGYCFRNKLMFQSYLLIIPTSILLVLCALFGSNILGETNVYTRQLGNIPLLYYPLSFIGIMSVVFMSSIFFKIRSSFVSVISQGTILIMGLHGIIVLYLGLVMKYAGITQNILFTTNGKFFLAMLVIFISFFLIKLAMKYWPSLLGKRGSKKVMM